MEATEVKPKEKKVQIIYKDLSEKKKSGRPTKYKPEYCEQLIKYFNREPYEEKEIVSTGKNDFSKVEYKRFPNKLPTFHQFAESIDVNEDTLIEWTKTHDDFSVAYKKAKNLQKYFIIENGMSSLYNPTFAIFTAKNITDMRDKVYTEEENKKPETQVTINNYDLKDIAKLSNQDLISKMKELRNNA